MKNYLSTFALILAGLGLPACSSAPSSDPGPMMFAKSVDALADERRQSEAHTSFNPADLSGCWQFIRSRPVYETMGGQLILRKTAENQYAVKDGANGKLIVTGTRVRYERADSEPQTGETRFEAWPYQIVFAEVVGLGGLERNQYGWEWAGKSCA